MLSTLLAITMIIQVAPASARGSVDLSTPKAAARAFGAAVLAGDRARAQMASLDTPASNQFISRLIRAVSTQKNLETISQSVLHIYPEVDHGILQELRTFPTYTSGTWDIQGDQARWLLDKSATPGVRVTETRVNGKWEVNPESMNNGMAAKEGDELDAFSQTCGQLANDIVDHKLHNTDEIRGAFQRYQSLALQHAPLNANATPPPATPFVVDLSTPQSALRGALVAEQTWDPAALLAALDPHDPARPLLQGLVDSNKARIALRDALLKRFGKPAGGFDTGPQPSDALQRACLVQAVETFKVVVTGDEAHFDGKDWPIAHKQDGQWRISIEAHFAPEKHRIERRIAEAAAIQPLLNDVNAGKFNSFADFQVAYAQKQQAVFAKMQESRTE